MDSDINRACGVFTYFISENHTMLRMEIRGRIGHWHIPSLGMAIGNGILTVENEAQALVRADPAQNDQGGEAAKAAMALLDLQGRFAG